MFAIFETRRMFASILRLEVQRDVNLIDLIKSCPTRVYYYLVLLAKLGFDTAEIEPRKVWVTELADLMFRSHNESLVIAVSVREFETPQFGFGS